MSPRSQAWLGPQLSRPEPAGMFHPQPPLRCLGPGLGFWLLPVSVLWVSIGLLAPRASVTGPNTHSPPFSTPSHFHLNCPSNCVHLVNSWHHSLSSAQ